MNSPDRPPEAGAPVSDETAAEADDPDTPPRRDGNGSLAAALRANARTAVGLVVAVALFGLLLRLVLLGDRIAHWDEGRVGYWIVYYQETGSFVYRRIIHGPFIQHVNRWLFALVGANDFTMRLPVALVSATLPLSAVLFREHLRKAEMVALALFLAVNPVVLYYSRFMRSDLLVATFMFLALGTLVRFYDTRRYRYLYAASALMACGFAAKENAILYVLTWLGALGLLADQALYRPRDYPNGFHLLAAKVRGVIGTLRSSFSPALARVGREGPDDSGDRVRTLWSAFRPVARPLGHLAGVAVVFLALSLFFYAPRGEGMAGIKHPPMTSDQIMFWQAMADPSLLPTLVEQTWQHTASQYGHWFAQAGESGERTLVSVFAEYLGRYVEVMGHKAAPLTVLGVAGFAYERYARERSRNLVLFSAYCGFVSVVGYPLGTDIFGAWLVVHSLVPLAVPAAVGLGVLVELGRAAFVADDGVGVIAAVVVLLLVGGQIGVVATQSVYLNPQSDDNHLVQYAQPSGDFRAEIGVMRQVANNDSRSGTDVLLYYGEPGDRYRNTEAIVEKNPSSWNQSRFSYRPVCSKWFSLLPLPWYFASTDAEVDCARNPGTVTDRIASDPPAMIISVETDRSTPWGPLSENYTRATYSMRTSGTHWVYWIHESIDVERETDESPAEPTPVGPAGR